MAMRDPFGNTDKLDDSLLDVMAKRLEVRGVHPCFQRVLADYLDAMSIDTARAVLDLGCGTGLAARAIARRAKFAGKVTGIDLSPYLAEQAARLAAAEGLNSRVAFRAGDTRSLDLGDGAFDAVVAHTLLSHVDRPLAVLKEAARVVRPGGMIAIFDGDYASLTFALEDAERTEAHDRKVIAGIITSPHVMRQMPRLLRQAGLELVKTFSYVIADIGEADFWLSAVEAFSKLLPKSGAMTEDEANRWVMSLKRASDEGVFFAASNYYTYVARRQ
jgi:ubiquinone/menaquinone biosynthesis C-methylase UbiE